MVLRIINAILILTAVFMGLKQGMAMFTGKPEMLRLFHPWGFSRAGVMINGAVTVLAALLILFPRTFVWGNFLMAAGILLIICFHFADRNWNGVLVELPFLALNLVIIYLHHPLEQRV